MPVRADPGVEPTASWTPPEVFDEYRLVRRLGHGAAGRVFLAHDTVLDRPVAIKFLIAELAPGVLERFLVEARAAARIQHPNVAILYRVGQLGRRPYLVSEYVRGRALADLPVPMPWQDAAALIVEAARGLAAAHRRGVLHADISPANVVLSEGGEVKLVDFGLARLEAGGDPGVEHPGSLVGTPVYAAPEIWRGEPATRRSDLYALAAVAYELCVGQAPQVELGPGQLPLARASFEIEPVDAFVSGIPASFSAAVMRALRRDPAERFASVDELREALELGADRPKRAGPSATSPYRGLRPFGPEHRDLFFGRERETLAVVDRLRSSAVVVVAGDSGVGKSSLCAAGVIPAVLEGALDPGRTWSAARLVPGRRPLAALTAALGAAAGLPARAEDAPERGPGELAREVRQALAEKFGLVVYVDQSEELVTLAGREEAEACAQALAALGAAGPSVKVLVSARSDFLTRLAGLPGLGAEVGVELFLLAPLSREGLRAAVVGPARMRGLRFESDALVEELVETSAVAEGGLPLLQFALAELWEARDPDTATLTYRALRRIGGVEGALARHGDGVLAWLGAEARQGARRVLVRLVTAEGTRARRTGAELVQVPADREALDALVSGRLVVASEREEGATYELAHEALVRGWATLAGWLADSLERRALEQRVEAAAREWRRLGEAREALWGARQLEELEGVDDAAQREPERAFLRASRASVARRRRVRWAVALLVPAGVLLTWGGFWLREHAAEQRKLHEALGRAGQASAAAAHHAGRAAALAGEAYAAFDRLDPARGEERWAEALAERNQADRRESEALHALEAAALLAPEDQASRARLAALLEARAERAEEQGRADVRDEALQRLALHDEDGSARERFDRPGVLALTSEPPAAVQLLLVERGNGTFRDRPAGPARAAPLEGLRLPAGSYVLVLSAPGHHTVRAPVLLGRGERVALHVALPRAGEVPDGFVYVPAGRFLVGSRDESLRRDFLKTVPLHAVDTGAFLIGRAEVTYREWFVFLDALAPAERARRTPGVAAKGFHGGLRVTRARGGRWRVELQPAAVRLEAAEGEPVRYPARDRRQAQDWLRFPVSGITWEDMQAYAAWLGETGRVPRARPCREDEWERAARGADGRQYPSGERLGRDDANLDLTYGKDPRSFGPDEAGAHPAGASPFGVYDLAGNVWELTSPRLAPGTGPVARGGSYYFSLTSARSANREPVEPTLRDLTVGFRVCADVRGAR